MNSLTLLTYVLAAWFAAKTAVILMPWLEVVGRASLRGTVQSYYWALSRFRKPSEISPVRKLSQKT